MKRESLLLWLLGGVVLAALALRTGVVGMISEKTRALIHRLEGLRLEAYRDTAGKWTIGYGHLILPADGLYPYSDVKTITQERADALYLNDSAIARKAVTDLVRVPLTEGQRSALESFAFNVGRPQFSTSTLLKLLNTGDYASAAAQFASWNKVRSPITGLLVADNGLANRRAVEKSVFQS